MKRLLALLAMVSMAQNAQAITSTFTFDVLSSGPDIYVCNAGIKHKNPRGVVSDRQGNGVVSTDDQGDYLQDVMEYTLGELDIFDTDKAVQAGQPVRVRANGSRDFVTAIGKDGNANQLSTQISVLKKSSNKPKRHKKNFGKHNEKSVVLTSVQFELSSERYGSEYFVDVCYYGPRFHSAPVGTIFVAQAQATFKDIHHNSYRTLSGLTYRVGLFCDGQKEKVVGPFSANSNAGRAISNLNLGGNAKDKCIFRYYFQETSNGFRSNGKHGVNVELMSEITDPAELN